MPPRTARSAGGDAASAFALGFVILAAGHLLLYVVLTGAARTALADIASKHEVAQLEVARDPGPPPQPGSEAYSAWLGAYETWWASKDYTLQDRHETMVKTGMALSFLVGLGLLGQGMMRVARTRRAPARARRREPVRRPARVVPLRPVATRIAVRPIPVRRRRSA